MEYARSNAVLSLVPLRSPITRGARSARCGSSSLRRSVEGGWCMECCSHDCAACSAVQLALRVVPLHAPLAAGCTRRQSLLARLDTWAPARLLLDGLEPALLGSLHLRHCVTMCPKRVSLMRLPRGANMLADAIMSGAAIASHALHSSGGRCIWAVMRS